MKKLIKKINQKIIDYIFFFLNKIYSKYHNGYKLRGFCIMGIIFIPSDIREKDKYLFELILNHERIHRRQQLETFFIGALIINFVFFIINIFKYSNPHERYLNTPLEREARFNEKKFDYLSERKLFSFFKYFNKKYNSVYQNK